MYADPFAERPAAPPRMGPGPDPDYAHEEPVRAALAHVMAGGVLSQSFAREAMGWVMDGQATPAQLGALLIALRSRAETVDELAGFAEAMRDRVVRVEAPSGAIDTCGTGGDGSGTFNISTAAALVAAAGGVPVAKHGNRAVTSCSGSADVLEALGISIELDPEPASAALRDYRFAFLFAPRYHPAMRHAGPVRRELGVPTCFNLLGPLTNPAGVRRQVVGVADPSTADRLAQVLHQLGAEHALVVNGSGLDELPLDGSGVIREVTASGVRVDRVDTRALGLAVAPTADLRSSDVAHSARIIDGVLHGAGGAARDVVLLNSGAAFMVGDRATNLGDGVRLAAQVIDSGAASALLARLRAGRGTVVESAA